MDLCHAPRDIISPPHPESLSSHKAQLAAAAQLKRLPICAQGQPCPSAVPGHSGFGHSWPAVQYLGAAELHVGSVHLPPQQLVQGCVARQDHRLVHPLHAPPAPCAA